jgi:DNA polymerase elongation subunit (family B)
MAMKCLNALYWDTDSVFIEGTFTDEEINEKLKRCSDWLPSNVVPVIVGDELGMLDCEMKNGKGYLAGTKRYYLQQFNEDGTPTLDKKGNEIKKVATHGIPALGKDRAGDVIKNLATGFNAFYESKPKPMKAKESKSKDEIGSFKSKSYEPKFQLDERLEWTKTKTGWIGNVKPYQLQLTDEQRQEQEYEQIRNQYKGKLIT